MKAVILAGGKGTRLAPYTHILPKPMMPVGDRAILEVILGQMSRAGISEVTLAVGHLASLMQTFFGDGSRYNLKITYAFEEKPLGTAGPLAFVEGLTDTFLVANGDILTLLDINKLIAFHKEQKAICTIASHQRTHKINLGVIEHAEGPIRLVDISRSQPESFWSAWEFTFLSRECSILSPRVSILTSPTWSTRFLVRMNL